MKNSRYAHRLLAVVMVCLMMTGMLPGAMADATVQTPAVTDTQGQGTVDQGAPPATDQTQNNAATDQTTGTGQGNNTPATTGTGDQTTQNETKVETPTVPQNGTEQQTTKTEPSKPTLVKLKLKVSCDADAPVAGGSYTLSASLSGVKDAPKGHVAFSAGGEAIGCASVGGTSASISWTPTSAGSYAIMAEYVPAAGEAYAYAAAQASVYVAEAPSSQQGGGDQGSRQSNDQGDPSGTQGSNGTPGDTGTSQGNQSSGSTGEGTSSNNTDTTTDATIQNMINALNGTGNENNDNTDNTDNGNTDNGDSGEGQPVRAGRSVAVSDLLKKNASTTEGEGDGEDGDESGEKQDGEDGDESGEKQDGEDGDESGEKQDGEDGDESGEKQDGEDGDESGEKQDGEDGDESGDKQDGEDGDESGDKKDGEGDGADITMEAGAAAVPGQKQNLANCTATVTSVHTYNGKRQEPLAADIEVMLGSTKLTAGVDYTLAAGNPYGPNVNAGAGAGSVRIQATADSLYVTGSKTLTFTINALDISGATVTASPAVQDMAYTGVAIMPTVSGRSLTVDVGGTTVNLGSNYTVTNNDNVNVSDTASVTIGARGNFTGNGVLYFRIVPRSITGAGVTIMIPEKPYDGSTDLPKITFRYGNYNLIEGTDYTATLPSSPNPGNYTITLTGIGNFKDSLNRVLVIRQGKMPDATIKLTDADYEKGGIYYYTIATGQTIRPIVSVSIGTMALVENQDYVLQGQTSTSAPGTYSITIQGRGSYANTWKNVQYTVGRSIDSDFTMDLIPDQRYTGRAVTPLVTIRNSQGNVLSNRFYTLGYENNVNRGTATVTAYGANGYVGRIMGTFEITEAATRMELAPYYSGNSIVLYAKVYGSLPTGTVTFTVTEDGGSSQTYDVALNASGEARYSVARNTNGKQYQVYAYYGGDSNNGPADAGPVSFNVVSLYLENLGTDGRGNTQLRATVYGSGGYMPTGRIAFRVNDRIVGYAPIGTNGVATFYVYTPVADRVTLSAYYEGDRNYAAATSNTIVLNDNTGKYIPNVSVKVRKSSSSYRTAYITATVSGTGWYGQPSGYVDFYDGTKHLGIVQLSSKGTAELTWRNISSGTHEVYAIYRGDTVYRSESAMTTYKRPSSTSSSSNSGGGTTNIVTPQTPKAQPFDPKLIQLRDADGNVVASYDPSNLTMQNEVIILETTSLMDYYSYSFGIPQLKTMASRSEGYYNVVAPNFNFHIPLNIMDQMEGYNEFVSSKGLSDSQVQLRLSIRRITDNALNAAYERAHPGKTPTAVYRVEIELYDTANTKLDFSTTKLGNPVLLLVPANRQSGIGERYDELTGTFVEVPLTFSDQVAILTVEQSGIYVIALDSF